MKNSKSLQLLIFLMLSIICYGHTLSDDSDGSIAPSTDSLVINEEIIDTIWNVVVYVEFGVDSNGHIHDVAAEQQFECYLCDSTMIDKLKKEAVETVEAMPKWENQQHKDIRYEIPIHMVKTHPHHEHKVVHDEDSIRHDTD